MIQTEGGQQFYNVSFPSADAAAAAASYPPIQTV